MSNPLDAVWNWYTIARDCLRVTTRVLDLGSQGAVTYRHRFFSMTASDAKQQIEDAQSELDNLAVVAMVAVFERTLRNYVTDLVVPALPAADAFEVAIRNQVRDDIEYWPITARLIDEVFKQRVPGHLCGMIKQIIDYRNDVAHGHVRGMPPPRYAEPRIVYRRLSDFLAAGGLTRPEHGSDRLNDR